MKFKLNLILMFFAVLLISCSSKEQEKEIEELKSETIAIHDEVMPKMDDVMKLKKTLKLKAEQDSIGHEDSTNLQVLIISLENSDRAMMDWMRNYDSQMQDMSESEKIEYLKNQKASIKEVRAQMKESISNAENYLNH